MGDLTSLRYVRESDDDTVEQYPCGILSTLQGEYFCAAACTAPESVCRLTTPPDWLKQEFTTWKHRRDREQARDKRFREIRRWLTDQSL